MTCKLLGCLPLKKKSNKDSTKYQRHANSADWDTNRIRDNHSVHYYTGILAYRVSGMAKDAPVYFYHVISYAWNLFRPVCVNGNSKKEKGIKIENPLKNTYANAKQRCLLPELKTHSSGVTQTA